ncbi:MAG: membrane dipeptidase [Firmicutes bacterium]|nr:membrane dipeptidase [Bacillota bacterium]
MSEQPTSWPYWPLVDGHMDTISTMYEGKLDFSKRQTNTHSDLPRLLEAGVGVQVLALFARPNPNKSITLQKILSYLEYVWQLADEDPRIEIVETSIQLPTTQSSRGKLWAILAVEGGDCLGGELWVLRLLHRLGVRLLTLTWSNRNLLADGIWEADSKGGLTCFGKEVVQEMGRLGMIVDVSHLSPTGFWDVAEIVRGPFVASHSNVQALCGHRRNLSDDQIRCIAEHGGVIGVNFCGPHLTEAGEASLDDVVAHVEYLWQVAGEDHVGLGTDYDGIDLAPKGLGDVTCLPWLIHELGQRGHSQDRLVKFAGGNFLRVFREILPIG